MAWLPWSKSPAFDAVEARSSVSVSVGDPASVDLLGLGTPSVAGISVGETSVLGLASVYRAVSLISGSIASLPMRTIVTNSDGHTDRTGSFLDTPAGPGNNVLTPFELKETVLVHLLLHGNAYLGHVRGGAGQLIGLLPIHPLAVTPEIDDKTGLKFFTVNLADGTRRVFFADELTHVPALSTDGIKGLSPLALARGVFSTSMAGDQAAARMFGNGMMVSGIVTPDDDLTSDEALEIKTNLRRTIQGTDNVGDVVLVNRKLKFQQWSLSAEDAQFLQSRAFQLSEVARWFGVPNHLLAVTENSTTFGTGLGELNRAYARYTLEPWTTRVEQRLSRLLPANKKVEFDYSAFVQPAAEVEIPLLIQQVESGLISINEARKIRNMPPVPGGDALTSFDAQTNPDAEIDSPVAQFGASNG